MGVLGSLRVGSSSLMSHGLGVLSVARFGIRFVVWCLIPGAGFRFGGGGGLGLLCKLEVAASELRDLWVRVQGLRILG